MKKYFILGLLMIVKAGLYAQVLCVQCFNQNGRISPSAPNLLLNGSLENGCNVSGKFCPASNNFSCNITNWTCTGGGTNTYAGVVGPSFSLIPDGTKAAYFGNSYCNGCSPFSNDVSCFHDSGCVVTGIPAGFPTHSSSYGGTNGVNLEQTVTGLTPGNAYVLEFWAGGESFAIGGIFAVDVGYGKIFLRNNPTPNAVGLGTRFVVQFIASNSFHTIRFTNWGHVCTSCTELVLDDIVLYNISDIAPGNIFCTEFSINNTCLGDTTSFNVVNISQIDSVSWNFDDPASGAQNYSNLFGPYHYYANPGIYNVTLIKHKWGGAIDTVTSQVNINTPPTFSLGNDTVACRQITLLPASGFSAYQWSNGSTNQEQIIDSAGTYTVTVTNNFGCTASDSIHISLFLPSINLGSDTSVCGQSMVPLTPGNGFSTYMWNTGATTPFINALQSGSYYVQVTDTNGCTASDTILVLFHPLPYINLGPDIISCGPYTLNAGAGYSTYVWSTGSTSQTTLVDVTNQYWVSVTDNFQCPNRDTVHVTIIPLPDVHLGSDTALCNGNTLVLNATSAFNNYLWQNGSTDSTFTVTQPGTYYVTVHDSSCTGSDTIVVTTSVCAPDPSMTASSNLLCKPGCINFFDQSVNGPTTWTWFFPNATPDTSTAQNPVNICYSQPGTYPVTLIACNVAGCNTAFISAFVSVLTAPSVSISLSNDTLFASPSNLNYVWYEFSQPGTILSSTSFYVTTQSGYYYAVATDSNGCEITSNIMLVTTSIHDLVANANVEIKYQSKQLYVTFKNAITSKIECIIYDMRGRLIMQKEFNSIQNTIDLHSASKGLYFLELQTGEKVYREKFWVD